MGRRSLKAHRRKEIIEAFYHTAAEEGIHNTSIAKIAEVMEVNPSLILHYFKNRNEMVYELVNYILDGYLQLYDVDQSQPAIDQLKDVLSNLFSREWNALISDDVYYSCYSLIFRDPTIQQKYKTLNDSLRESLAGHLEACVNEGVLSIKDPRQTANLVYTFAWKAMPRNRPGCWNSAGSRCLIC
jgi:AcrR family transcriptional regulator